MAERKVDAERQVRLLVVEDDPRIAGVLVKGLHKQGYAAESVESGGGAIARIEAGDVDVLLLDLGLPDIDGLDVLRMLRERGSDLPVIVVTSRSDPRDRATAVELGVHTYLTKPFAWGDVWTAVRQCVVAHDQA